MSSSSPSSHAVNHDQHDHHHLSLLQPTASSPWSVDVWSASPTAVMKRVTALTQPLATATMGRWHAVATEEQTQAAASSAAAAASIHVWYNNDAHHNNHPSSLVEQLHTQAILTVQHERLLASNPLQLHFVPTTTATSNTNSNNSDGVLLYAVDTSSGWMVVWKLFPDRLLQQQQQLDDEEDDALQADDVAMLASCRIPLRTKDDNDNNNHDEEDEDEQITTVVVAPTSSSSSSSSSQQQQQHHQQQQPVLIVGTSQGNLYWITLCRAPICLTCQPVVEDTTTSSSSSSSSSIFGKLFATPSKLLTWTQDYNNNNNNNNEPIRQIVFLSSEQQQQPQQQQQSFLVETNSKRILYSWTRMSSSSTTTNRIFFRVERVVDWNTLLVAAKIATDRHDQIKLLQTCAVWAEEDSDDNNDDGDDNSAASATVSHTHSILLVQPTRRSSFSSRMDDTTTKMMMDDDDDDDARLYWIVVDQDTQTIVDYQLLDRFVDVSQLECVSMISTMTTTMEAGGGSPVYAVLQPTLIERGQRGSAIILCWCPCYNNGNTNDNNNTQKHVLLELDPIMHENHLEQHFGRIWTAVGQEPSWGNAIYLMTNQGLNLRVRVLLRNSTLQATTTTTTGAAAASPSSSKTLALTSSSLVDHLTSQFTQFHRNPTMQASLPSSLKRASVHELQHVVLQVAKQLLLQSGSNNTFAINNHFFLQLHNDFLVFLKTVRLYDRLTTSTRFALLTHGQQIVMTRAICNYFSQATLTTEWEQEQWSRLQSPLHVLKWLENIQQEQQLFGNNNNHATTSEKKSVYLTWLTDGLEEAANYRRKEASYSYDLLLLDEYPPPQGDVSELPSWTIQLPQLLQPLIESWKLYPKTSFLSNTTEKTVQIVIQSALHALQDQYRWVVSSSSSESSTDNNNNNASHATALMESYVHLLKVGFDLLRLSKLEDALVWNVCLQHLYFGGLCQLAVDYSGTSSKSSLFAINSELLKKLQGKHDVATGWSMDKFVLKWLVDRKMIGKALVLGKDICPETLAEVMMEEELMYPHRWMISIRQNDYYEASEALLQHAIVDTSSSSSVLPVTAKLAQVDLATAKLYSILAQRESPPMKAQAAKKLQVVIDQKRELINAQATLMGDSFSSHETTVLSPMELLQLAQNKVEASSALEDKVQYYFVALAICASMESPTESANMAVSVWSRAILDDLDVWKNWMASYHGVGGGASSSGNWRERVRTETIFGGLIVNCERCRTEEDPTWENVNFGTVMATEVIGKLNIQDGQFLSGLRNLLSSATATY
jgi:hypothetical protein